jgi:hypothetical protein
MFITGWTDKEGNSLAYEPLGMFTSPSGDKWSNLPYTKEQKKISKNHDKLLLIFNKVTGHLSRTDRTILEEIKLIKEKKSTLPKYCREWLLNSQKLEL